jgi:cytochrome oxidase Cu insertion factor (SCO1/SenC/PrrC family)
MTRVLAALALAVSISACGGDLGTSPRAEVPSGAAARGASELAPDFTVQTFTGESFSLSDQRGRLVVLNFFESW